MNSSQSTRAVKDSKVKGPSRCHKWQLMCRDAEHYLSRISNKCEVEPSVIRWRPIRGGRLTSGSPQRLAIVQQFTE